MVTVREAWAVPVETGLRQADARKVASRAGSPFAGNAPSTAAVSAHYAIIVS
jgi:hypothetical protein